MHKYDQICVRVIRYDMIVRTCSSMVISFRWDCRVDPSDIEASCHKRTPTRIVHVGQARGIFWESSDQVSMFWLGWARCLRWVQAPGPRFTLHTCKMCWMCQTAKQWSKVLTSKTRLNKHPNSFRERWTTVQHDEMKWCKPWYHHSCIPYVFAGHYPCHPAFVLLPVWAWAWTDRAPKSERQCF